MSLSSRLPTFFVSHGAPSMGQETNSPTVLFLKKLGQSILSLKPRAVVIISAHWEASPIKVNAASQHSTYHDHGFPDLFSFKYPATGDTELAKEVHSLIRSAGLPSELETKRGLDHGVWVPLSIMFPDGSLPVVQVSLHSNSDPSLHIRLGQALEPLRDQGVLLLGSGSSTHNLYAARAYFSRPQDTTAPEWSDGFEAWLRDTLAKPADERNNALIKWEEHKYAKQAHPSPEHFLPVLVISGAASSDKTPENVGVRLHQMNQYSLSLSAYQFSS